MNIRRISGYNCDSVSDKVVATGMNMPLGDHVHGGLTSAMAYPANWKQSALPKTLTTEEVAQLVNALGRPGPSMCFVNVARRPQLTGGP